MSALIWIGLCASAAIILPWAAVRAIQWAKKGTKGTALLATIAFPNPEHPSPQQLAEEETLRKKESGAGGPK